ncbi:MAG: UnbV [Chthonomonadales bacterium]|nr:UnbV [Chthonomonadales bacterium]
MSATGHISRAGSRLRLCALVSAIGVALVTVGCHDNGTGRPPTVKPESVHVESPRPENAGPADPLFRDVAESAGLRYVWSIPGTRPLNILQTIGNGCAFLDYDHDGNLDILLVGLHPALYRGDGKGHFTEVTHDTGLDKLQGHFLGCAVGDYDNDGYDDICLTAYQGGALLHNEAGRGFRPLPLQAQPWGTSAAFVETVPGSGRLDLIVANYARFTHDSAIPQLCEQKSLQGASRLTSCAPRQYTPLKAVMFRNRGEGRFGPPVPLTMVTGRGLGVAACDFDSSGRQGVAFANDETQGDLLQNQTAGTFVNVGTVSSTAYDRDGNVHGGMGVDWGDSDNDGRFDLLVTTFQNESKCLYHNEGGGLFTEISSSIGLGAANPNVSFGCKFFDYDNDGWLDIAIANGHVQDNIAEFDAGVVYRQTLQLFRSQGAGHDRPLTFEEVSGPAGPDFARKIVGRGLAIGDYDNDGRVDLLVVDSEGKPLLLHNEVKTTSHWLQLRLIGAKSNRDGYGAVVTAEVGGRRLTRLCHADGSYMSSSDPRVHFGLGAAERLEALTIRWPSGQTEHLNSIPIDRCVTIREGKGILP